MLNVAVARRNDQARVVVGARPGRGRRCPQAETVLGTGGTDAATLAAEAAVTETEFGDDVRASADYRREICRTLVARATAEVLS